MTGSGTLLDPYIIYDVDDLQAVEDDLAAYYELANDIDASETITWNAGAGFLPIGSTDPFDGFTGHLDGKGHTIDSLFINSFGVGLFYLNDGTAQNIKLTNVDFTSASQCGSFAYWNTGVFISCHASGTLSGTKVGGFVQYNEGTIDKCSTTCTITATSDAGGFVQYNGGAISDCYARGNLTGDGGALDEGGGFLQANGVGATIDNCYSTGSVTNFGNSGGFCWDNGGAITDCFWDTEASGEAASDGGTGKTTAEMKTVTTFTDAGWDLLTIWNMLSGCNDGYPCLRGVTPCCVEAAPGSLPDVLTLLM